MSQEKIDVKINLEGVISRFREAFRFASDKEAATALGLSAQDFFHRKKRGTLLPLIIEFAVDTFVNCHWLVTGKGPLRTSSGTLVETAIPAKCLNEEEYRLIPLLQSWVKAGPEGIFMDEAYEDYYPFKTYFLEKLVGTRPERQKQLFLARVKGDSMAPTINHGEMILFDTNEAERIHVQTGDIYLVLLPEGTVAVKRLSLNIGPQGARLVCHSDNLAAYKMFAFDLPPGKPIQSYVLGRVRWAGKEFD